jgi:4a-hydroxytetrahydrobiopterin dehydratase
MGSRQLLTPKEIETLLSGLSGWSLRDGRLHRELVFGTFDQAFGFMTAVALIAQRLDHHPEFHNVYDRVSLTLWTHDAGGLTGLDFALAEAAERLVERFQPLE